jgi:hypothetical protein
VLVRSRRTRGLQKLLAVHGSVLDHFNSERCLSSRIFL